MDRVERDFIALACIVMGKWADAGLIDGDDTSRQGDEDPEWRKAKIAVATVQQYDGPESDETILRRINSAGGTEPLDLHHSDGTQ